MKKNKKSIDIQRQNYEENLKSKQKLNPIVMNLSLLSHPSLSQNFTFSFLKNIIQTYNLKAKKLQIDDHYQIKAINSLYAFLQDICKTNSQPTQHQRLTSIHKWWQNQEKLLKQRKQQQDLRYKTDRKIERIRELRNNLSLISMMDDPANKSLSEERKEELKPFEEKNRTIHQATDVPIKQLFDYNRKIGYLKHQAQPIKELKLSRILYPMPQRIHLEQDLNPETTELQTIEQTEGEDKNSKGNVVESGIEVQPTIDGQPSLETDIPQNQEIEQDFGALQQQPEDNQEQQEDQALQLDKLAPKQKIYMKSIRQLEVGLKEDRNLHPVYSGGQEELQPRRMQDRYVRIQHQSLQLQRQQQHSIEVAHRWAVQKAKINKDIQLKLETKALKNYYSISFQQEQKNEYMSASQEKKYGISLHIKKKKISEIDLHENWKLPALNDNLSIENDMRKHRLASLKHRFANILQLQDYEKRQEITGTLCQISPKRKGLSFILESHSRQKERMMELEEINKIKHSLARNKINIDMNCLAEALCPPAEEIQIENNSFPNKQLMSNPFMVEVKKKKKKK